MHSPAMTLLAPLLLLAPTPTQPPAAPGPPATANERARLSALQEDMFQHVATDEFCGCQSSLTLAGCLQKKPGCGVGKALEQVLAKLVEQNTSQGQVQGFFSRELLGPLCAPQVTFKLPNAPTKGKAGAPLTLVEFADFRCHHCRLAAPLVHAAVARDPRVNLIYIPIALAEGEPSLLAAEAAMAAHAQGKFWDMHAALFAREAGDFDTTTLRDTAKKVGLNLKTFDRDMAEHRYRETLTGWRKQSLDAGVTGTPAFFLNGRRMAFAPDILDFADTFALEAARGQGDCG